jgi:hypothetical protein
MPIRNLWLRGEDVVKVLVHEPRVIPSRKGLGGESFGDYA